MLDEYRRIFIILVPKKNQFLYGKNLCIITINNTVLLIKTLKLGKINCKGDTKIREVKLQGKIQN